MLFAYSILGFIILPYLIQSNFTKVIKNNLNANGSLNRVYVNPFTFKIVLNKLLIQDDQHKTLLYFKSLETDFELLELLFQEIELDYLEIDSLKTSFTLYEDQTFNFQEIINHLNQNKDNDATEDSIQNSSQFIFTINEFLLKNTRISFTDKTKAEEFKIKTKAFNFEMKDFSTKYNTTATIVTNINIVDTAKLNISSNFILTPLQAKGNFLIQQIKLEKIYSYLKDTLDFQFTGIIQNISSSFDIQLENEQLEFNINKIKLKSDDIFLTDLITNKNNTLKFQNLNIDIDKITNNKKDNSHLVLSVNTPQSGKIDTKLDIKQDPLDIEGIVTLQQLNISPYQDYIKNLVNIDIHNTLIDIDSEIKIDKETQNIHANIKLSDIDLSHSISKKNLLQVKQFDINGLKYTNNNLFIEDVILNDFETSIKIDKKKNTNIDDLIVKKGNDNTIEKKDEKAQTQTDFHYYIKKLTISNGKTDFSDHSLPLNFDTKIHDLNADINNLSSKNKETNINLTGTIDKYGLANINAKSIFSNFKDKTEVTIDFENLDVKSFSPYSGKFIGQKIADGKLWLDLNYTISKSQLTSTNNIKIKNLALGEDVKSKDALNLPINLAIALLEDNEGLIELDVPITGDMKSPDFELSGVIWKTLGNVITNVVSAPFKFLGSLLGIDSSELGTIEFNFAQSEISPPQKEKLDKLIGLLQKKKKLIILIQPTINIIQDKQKLQRIKFEQMIKSKNKEEKIKEIYTERFGDERIEVLLEETKEEKQIELLSQEIIDSIIITNKELNLLAQNRANNIKKYFVSNKLTLDRIQVKDEIFQNKNKNIQNLLLKLELNIKE